MKKTIGMARTTAPNSGSSRGLFHKEESWDKYVRIRTTTYKNLVLLGTNENDIDDVVSMLYDFWRVSKQKEEWEKNP